MSESPNPIEVARAKRTVVDAMKVSVLSKPSFYFALRCWRRCSAIIEFTYSTNISLVSVVTDCVSPTDEFGAAGSTVSWMNGFSCFGRFFKAKSGDFKNVVNIVNKNGKKIIIYV